MHTYKKITEIKDIEIVEDIICNRCGAIMNHDITGEPEGLTECYIEGGYDSKYIGDGVSFKFDLCEGCVVELMKQFIIPAEKKDWNEPIGEEDDNTD